MPVVVHGLREDSGRLDRSGGKLQVPVAPKRFMPGLVHAGCYVRAGQNANRFDQLTTDLVGGKVASVEKQVRSVGQRVPPTRDVASISVNATRRQPDVTKLDLACRAM